MKRRHLLALLGVGSAGSLTVSLFPERTTSLVEHAFPSNASPDSEQPATPDDETTPAGWEQQLQSELQNKPRYGEVSYASDSETVEVADDDLLSTIAVEATGFDGDLFKFTAQDRQAAQDTAALVDATLRFSGNVSFTATFEGASITFTGGASPLGPFAGAVGTHSSDPVVILVRAADANQLDSIVDSAGD